MHLQRPDLSQVDPPVKAYIEALEAELEQRRRKEKERTSESTTPLEPDEPPTTLNVVTVTRGGIAKRTPRHLYSRQRRGGMGIFDLEAPDDDPPAHLLIADQDQDFLIVTNQGRAFRLPVKALPESPVRSRGKALLENLRLNPGEGLGVIVPHQRDGYLALVTNKAFVRRFRYHYFRDDMSPGSLLYDPAKEGTPLAACWSSGEDELFIATRQGKAIRFPEQKVTTMGCLAVRLSEGDVIVGVAGVNRKSSVALVTADGKGTIRLMSGFSANKAPGAGGKVAIKTDQLIGLSLVSKSSDLFIISRLSKLIRFQASEIPAKEGIVQGVNCMALRADEAVVVTA